MIDKSNLKHIWYVDVLAKGDDDTVYLKDSEFVKKYKVVDGGWLDELDFMTQDKFDALVRTGKVKKDSWFRDPRHLNNPAKGEVFQTVKNVMNSPSLNDTDRQIFIDVFYTWLGSRRTSSYGESLDGIAYTSGIDKGVAKRSCHKMMNMGILREYIHKYYSEREGKTITQFHYQPTKGMCDTPVIEIEDNLWKYYKPLKKE